MDIKAALSRIADRQDLSLEEMQDVMRQIMTGEATDAQIGAFLMGLRMKGETIDEITGAVMVMRSLASAVELEGEHLVDIVGTSQSNISQHLEQLRNKNIVVSRKEANRIYYRIRNPQLLELIGTMRQVLCPANLDDRPPQG